jgi:hypothetical protein
VVTAYVLIQAEVGTAGRVASAAAEINGVQQAQPVTGPYDVTRTLTCPVVHL